MTASRSKVEKFVTYALSMYFGLISDLNHTINPNLVTKFMVWFNMEAIPKFDIKSVIKSDTSIKLTTWIGQLPHKFSKLLASNYASKWSVESV